MFGHRRGLAPIVAALLVVAACSSDDAQPPAGDPTPGGLRSITETVDELEQAIANSGFGLVSRVSDPLPDDLLTLTDHQLTVMAEEVAASSGFLGAALDEVTPMPHGVPALSFWLAAWLHDAPTPRAEIAAAWYEPDTDWTQAPSLIFPRAVVFMFVADVAEDVDRNAPPLDADARFLTGGPSASGQIPTHQVLAAGPGLAAGPDILAGPIGSACEVISSFFGTQIAGLFNALRLSEEWLGSGGVFRFVGGLIAQLWNTVIGLASDVTVGLVRNLTAPVVQAIATAVAIAGIVSHIGSYIQGWNIDVDATPGTIAFAVGSAPDNVGSFEVAPVSGHRPWQPDLESCARSMGVILPKLLEPGSPVEWTVTQSSPGLIDVTSRDDVIREGTMPVMRYRAGREDSDDGDLQLNRVDVSARIPRAELHNVLALVRNRIDATVDWIVTSTLPVPALADIVRAELHRVLDPVLRQLDAAVAGELADTPLVVQGTTNLIVVNHSPTTTTTSTTTTTVPEEPQPRTCPHVTEAEVVELTGVAGLALGHVYLPGDTIEGQFVSFVNCAWGNPGWSVHYALYRTPNAMSLYSTMLEHFSEPSIIHDVVAVPGPWDAGFSWVFLDTQQGGFQLFAASADLYLEVLLWGEPYTSAVPLATHVWRRAGG